MKCLRDGAELATGDPIFCSKCQAVLNKYSLIEENKHDENQIWTCEFCNNSNEIQVEPEEMPK